MPPPTYGLFLVGGGGSLTLRIWKDGHEAQRLFSSLAWASWNRKDSTILFLSLTACERKDERENSCLNRLSSTIILQDWNDGEAVNRLIIIFFYKILYTVNRW